MGICGWILCPSPVGLALRGDGRDLEEEHRRGREMDRRECHGGGVPFNNISRSLDYGRSGLDGRGGNSNRLGAIAPQGRASDVADRQTTSRDRLAHRAEMRGADSDSSANERRGPPQAQSRRNEGGPSNSSVVASNGNIRDLEPVQERATPHPTVGHEQRYDDSVVPSRNVQFMNLERIEIKLLRMRLSVLCVLVIMKRNWCSL